MTEGEGGKGKNFGASLAESLAAKQAQAGAKPLDKRVEAAADKERQAALQKSAELKAAKKAAREKEMEAAPEQEKDPRKSDHYKELREQYLQCATDKERRDFLTGLKENLNDDPALQEIDDLFYLDYSKRFRWQTGILKPNEEPSAEIPAPLEKNRNTHLYRKLSNLLQKSSRIGPDRLRRALEEAEKYPRDQAIANLFRQDMAKELQTVLESQTKQPTGVDFDELLRPEGSAYKETAVPTGKPEKLTKAESYKRYLAVEFSKNKIPTLQKIEKALAQPRDESNRDFKEAIASFLSENDTALQYLENRAQALKEIGEKEPEDDRGIVKEATAPAEERALRQSELFLKLHNLYNASGKDKEKKEELRKILQQPIDQYSADEQQAIKLFTQETTGLLEVYKDLGASPEAEPAAAAQGAPEGVSQDEAERLQAEYEADVAARKAGRPLDIRGMSETKKERQRRKAAERAAARPATAEAGTSRAAEALTPPLAEAKPSASQEALTKRLADLKQAKARLDKLEAEKKQYDSILSKIASKFFSSESERRANIEKEYDDAKARYENLERQIHGAGAEFSELNISRADLETVEGFKELTDGQRLLVLENLRQLTLGRIQEEAAAKYREATAQAKVLPRIWLAITKKYKIAKLERATAEEIKQGGLEMHKPLLEPLVRGTKELGLEVVEKDGQLEIHYAADLKDLTSEERTELALFNKAANKFARLPEEWSKDTATTEQRRKFAEAKASYDLTKWSILQAKAKRSTEKEALLYLSEIDNKVRLNQFLNANPEVEKELAAIESPLLWALAFKNVITERGFYAGLGFVTRSVTAAMIGAAAVPLATAGMGIWMARRRAREDLRERAQLARKGVKDVSKETRNVVDAKALAEKIDFLINKIENESDWVKRAALLGSLRARLSYTQDKIEGGLVNFGALQERLGNQYTLIDVLNRGEMYRLETSNAVTNRALGREVRLGTFLDLRQRKISEAQKKYLWDATVHGAILGAGAGLAGYAIRHFFFNETPNGAVANEAANVKGRVTLEPGELKAAEEAAAGKAAGTVLDEKMRVAHEAVLAGIKVEHLAAEALVRQNDGITSALARQIAFEPGAYKQWAADLGIKNWSDQPSKQLIALFTRRIAETTKLAGQAIYQEQAGQISDTWVKTADQLRFLIDPNTRTVIVQTVDGSVEMKDILPHLLQVTRGAVESLDAHLPGKLIDWQHDARFDYLGAAQKEFVSSQYISPVDAVREGIPLTNLNNDQLQTAIDFLAHRARAGLFAAAAENPGIDPVLKQSLLDIAAQESNLAHKIYQENSAFLSEDAAPPVNDFKEAANEVLAQERPRQSAVSVVSGREVVRPGETVPIPPAVGPEGPIGPELPPDLARTFSDQFVHTFTRLKPGLSADNLDWFKSYLPLRVPEAGRAPFMDVSPSGNLLVVKTAGGELYLHELKQGFEVGVERGAPSNPSEFILKSQKTGESITVLLKSVTEKGQIMVQPEGVKMAEPIDLVIKENLLGK